MSSKHYDYSSLSESLLDFIKNLVIKNGKRAESEETIESAKSANKYLHAYDKTDNFNSYNDWTKEELLAVSFPKDKIDEALVDYSLIPDNYREVLLENRRKNIVENYVEKNNYYRMLNGLPNLNEEPLMTSFNKYITELSEDELYQLELGELKELQNLHPDKEYLYHLGNAKVSFYEARSTNNFYILTYKKYILEETNAKKFIELYYESYVYVTSVVYTKAFTMYDYYDSFIILLIVFMTMQKYISSLYNSAIKKDFYDLESIKNIFLSYGLPFFDEIPLRYQKNIVNNINHLLKYKGTDKVLVDIVKLFGFTNVELFKYFLVKNVKRDVYGNPEIDYENPRNSYELKFAQIPFDTHDVASALQNTSLYQKYEEVVKDDPFWGTDDKYISSSDENEHNEFKNKLLDMEFNYVNTKYVSINTLFDVAKVNLDTCYLFNLINTLKKNNNIGTLSFVSNNIKPTGNTIRLFDAITAVYSLIHKRFGYEDLIINTSTGIASLYAFNFNTDLDILNENINKNSSISLNDGTKIKLNKFSIQENDIREMNLPKRNMSKEEIIDLYFNNIQYRDYIMKRMEECTDYREYKALNEIYKFNFLSESVTDLYLKPDGSVYEKYSDYLQDVDYELYSYITNNSQDKDSLLKTVDTILYSIETYLNSPIFDNIFSNLTAQTGDLIKGYILKIINVFKAYTIELRNINVYYIIDDKFISSLKMFTFIYNYTTLNKAESLSDYIDLLQIITKVGYNKETSRTKDKLGDEDEGYLIATRYLVDTINRIYKGELDEVQESLVMYIFDRMKAQFNVDRIMADYLDIDTNNINLNGSLNNLIEVNNKLLKDKLIKDDYLIITISKRSHSGIFDDWNDGLYDDQTNPVYSDL